MKLPFTDRALRELQLPPGERQLILWDTKQPGFGCILGPTGASYVVSYYRGKNKRREVLGRRDDMTLPEARKAAQAVVGRVAENKITPGDLRHAAKSGPTLAEAVADYLESMRNRSCRPTAITTVQRELADAKRSYLKAWLHRPLRSITARDARTRHAEISSANGKHVANRVFRNLRTVWSHVAREALVDDTTWPANPMIAVNWHSGEQPGFVERRREPIPWEKLPTWKITVDKLKNPTRRDYNLVVVLTGLRRTDACTLRWEHINLDDKILSTRVWHAGKEIFEPLDIPARSIFRPSPKGGAARAFFIPLSSYLVDVLRNRRHENLALDRGDKGWVFPSLSKKARPCSACLELGFGDHPAGVITHMTEPKEDDPVIVTPHRLRDTYLTAAVEAGIGEIDRKVLVNHTWGSADVTAGYVKQSLSHLRECQEKVTGFLVEKMRPPRPDHLRSVG